MQWPADQSAASVWARFLSETLQLQRCQARMPDLPDFRFADPGTQDVRDDDAAVGLLVVFEDRDQSAGTGDGGAVEGMCELRSFRLGSLETDPEPAGLVVGAVRCRGDFAVFSLLAAP